MRIFIWVCLIFQIFFRGKQEMSDPSLRMKKNESPPPILTGTFLQVLKMCEERMEIGDVNDCSLF